MAVSSMVILMVFYASALQVDGSRMNFSQFYLIQKALESALIRDETLYIMRQTYFPVVRRHAQEVHQVPIFVCVHITVDQLALNSTPNNSSTEASDMKVTNADNNSCRVGDSKSIAMNVNINDTANNETMCWTFQWTDSALLSTITIDQLVAFDVFAAVTYSAATGNAYFSRHIEASLPLICSYKPKKSVITTSLTLLLSWV